MTGKKWFAWLGRLHGSRKIQHETRHLPLWAQDAYGQAWNEAYYQLNHE